MQIVDVQNHEVVILGLTATRALISFLLGFVRSWCSITDLPRPI